jgi:predicted PurR-regulated permease PerM
MENVVDGAYNFGRDWISSTLQKSLAEADQEVRTDLETKVLELWDRSYQYWVLTSVAPAEQGPVVSKEAISSSVGEVLEKLFTSQIHANIFNYTAVQTFVKDNMGTLTSIMETSWTLFKGNIGFLFEALLGTIKIFFYGGTGVVNFMFGIVIYLTALFYLLSNSSNTYIPMDLITQYSLFQISGVGSSIQKAVNSVFLITVKMSSFYLLWTYLTHVIFQASIVVLPLLFSSFIAACPFTGQHIVALPAALELWLLQERPLAALLLVLMQVAPSWLVDAAIYSEIKGGIHPWFTGLAVVGGVYVFGPLGAIYGPLALCVLYVVMNVYTTFMEETEPETPDVRQGSGMGLPARTPLVRSGTIM